MRLELEGKIEHEGDVCSYIGCWGTGGELHLIYHIVVFEIRSHTTLEFSHNLILSISASIDAIPLYFTLFKFSQILHSPPSSPPGSPIIITVNTIAYKLSVPNLPSSIKSYIVSPLRLSAQVCCVVKHVLCLPSL